MIISTSMSVSSTYLPGGHGRFPSVSNREFYAAKPPDQIPWER